MRIPDFVGRSKWQWPRVALLPPTVSFATRLERSKSLASVSGGLQTNHITTNWSASAALIAQALANVSHKNTVSVDKTLA